MSNVINFYDAERQILTPAQAQLTAMRLVRNSLQELHLEMEHVLSKLTAATQAVEEIGAQEGQCVAKTAALTR